MSQKTILNIKTDVSIKKKARKAASEIGVPLSTLVNAFLRQLARDKRISFSAGERPSAYLQKAIEEAKNDLAEGKIKGPFNSMDALIKSLRAK